MADDGAAADGMADDGAAADGMADDGAADRGSAGGRGTGLAAGVDQVATVLPEREARQVFSSLSRLGLLVVWPYRDHGPFTTGAVRLGNLNIEVVGTSGSTDTGAAAGGDAGAGEPAAGQTANGGARPRQVIALAPESLAGLPATLEEHGIRHGEPEAFRAEAGGEPLYTTVDLPDLGTGGLTVQFRGYPNGPQTETVPSADLAGVQQVDRVVLGASDVERVRGQWAALLAAGRPETGGAPAPETGGAPQPENGGASRPEPQSAWQPEYGPALELRPASEDAITELVLRVRALATARAAFTAAGLPVTGDLVEIGTVPARLVTGQG